MSDGIRVIAEPTVYLLGRQQVNGEELQRFLADHDFANWSTDSPCDAETLVEVAARTCYQSFKGGRAHDEHIRHILEVSHGSCIEHAVWNFLFTGVSRSLTHELVRHRAGMGFSQLSQRFVDESDAEFVIPDLIQQFEPAWALHQKLCRFAADEDSVAAQSVEAEIVSQMGSLEECYRRSDIYDDWLRSVKYSKSMYAKLAKGLEPYAEGETSTDRRKAARQAARSVLPNATETKIFVTANARALRNMIELRASRHAETEIRKLAVAVLRVMQQEAPNLFSDYTLTPLPDGTFEATTPYRKV